MMLRIAFVEAASYRAARSLQCGQAGVLEIRIPEPEGEPAKKIAISKS
jgi:hypothetical protein